MTFEKFIETQTKDGDQKMCNDLKSTLIIFTHRDYNLVSEQMTWEKVQVWFILKNEPTNVEDRIEKRDWDLDNKID